MIAQSSASEGSRNMYEARKVVLCAGSRLRMSVKVHFLHASRLGDKHKLFVISLKP
jgi:hypothetical protein